MTEPKRHTCYKCNATAECWVWKDEENKQWHLCQPCLRQWIEAERKKLQSTIHLYYADDTNQPRR